MADNTLQGFYLKYRNKLARSLETDNYYQYLFELFKRGNNSFNQTNRILHKEVDEKWLTKVEDSINAIDAIISKPRRFIATEENLVPIELARKITAESVRHLSQHTQFISAIDEEGNVRPSQILNVSTKESFDLYENRFVNTLIHKLVTFIDKRTDILFWSTGDERYSELKIESSAVDDYEEIEYKLELKIKNKQSYMETDSQHMEVFKRIDRVRRIVMEFNRSAFIKAMDGTATVRSPIQRTNLITKDPNYKKCYALWSFLEQYDDVGYTIDVKENALEFDEEYVYQVYSNIILNYTVFKSLLEADQRQISEMPAQRRKTIKPKFIKKIVEEFVDDYDIPDVEIRKVIVEQITKAQFEIEKKQEQRKKELDKKEKERIAKQKVIDKEREKIEKENALHKEKERIAKQQLVEKRKREKQKALEAQKKQKQHEAERLKIQKQKQKEAEKARLTKQKALEVQKRLKQREAERLKIQKQKQKEAEKEKAQKQKLREKENAKKSTSQNKSKTVKKNDDTQK